MNQYKVSEDKTEATQRDSEDDTEKTQDRGPQTHTKRSAEELALRKWLDAIGLIGFADALAQMGVQSLADCAFVEPEDLTNQDIGMNVIQARKFVRARDGFVEALAGAKSQPPIEAKGTAQALSSSVPLSPVGRARFKSLRHSGPVLQKGYLPEAQPFNQKQMNRIRNRRYDAQEQKWVKRDIPLSEEELECWQDQARWLKCPITGKEWTSASTILGVGIYHAPRQVSGEEQQRRFQWEKDNALLNQAEENSKTCCQGLDDGDDPWWSTFYVYPNVDPPDKPFSEEVLSASGDTIDDEEDHDHSNSNSAESVEMGRVELMIGPAFDVEAYNLGIHGGKIRFNGVPTVVKSKSDRGVKHNDAQWNAMNFQYWISRDGGDNFIKKECTNRLSFYIEDCHGQRVFPKNIRSQLSLLLWRDRDRLTLEKGGTDETLLAVAVRKVLPRILLASIMEIFRGTSTAKKNKQCSEEYIEFAIRTYLLIHQVSIKLVVYFHKTRDILVESILRWIMAPLSKRAQKEWPHDGNGLPEFLIGASLVGVPWHLIREPFMRALFTQLMRSIRKPTWDPSDRARRLQCLFQSQNGYLHQILFVHSFFGTGRSVGELDRLYGRCAGTLPRSERDTIKARVTKLRKEVKSLEALWVHMGMEIGGADITEIQEHVDVFLKSCYMADTPEAGYYHWGLEDLPINSPSVVGGSDEERLALSTRRVRFFSDTIHACAGHTNSAVDNAARILAAERAKHIGYPTLNRDGTLPSTTCSYEGCGRHFRHRAQLFAHLRHMIGDARMIEGHHKSHLQLKQSQVTQAMIDGTTCPACGELFGTNTDLRSHLRALRGMKFMSDPSADMMSEQTLSEGGLTQGGSGPGASHFLESYYSDPLSCCICKASTHRGEKDSADVPPREAMLLPCGHFYACRECGPKQRQCLVCDQASTAVLDVAHVQASKKKKKADRATASCVVCLVNSATHAVVPCGHHCLCEGCAPLIGASGACPLGRCPIECIVKIYGGTGED